MRMEVKTWHEDEGAFDLEEGTCNCDIDIKFRNIIYVRRVCLIGNFGIPACRDCHKVLPVKELL